MRLFFDSTCRRSSLLFFSSITACSFEGEKQQIGTKALQKHKFKFTLPVWGETRCSKKNKIGADDFNPFSPYGESLSGVSTLSPPR